METEITHPQQNRKKNPLKRLALFRVSNGVQHWGHERA
jgi:hypothetical protein